VNMAIASTEEKYCYLQISVAPHARVSKGIWKSVSRVLILNERKKSGI
jgi:hypothetical protein